VPYIYMHIIITLVLVVASLSCIFIFTLHAALFFCWGCVCYVLPRSCIPCMHAWRPGALFLTLLASLFC
jgi:hypothetical protein